MTRLVEDMYVSKYVVIAALSAAAGLGGLVTELALIPRRRKRARLIWDVLPAGLGESVAVETEEESVAVETEEESVEAVPYIISADEYAEVVPYIISADEYSRGDSDYSRPTLVYFAEDDILADCDDSIVSEADTLLGIGTWTAFVLGRLPNKDTLYVRNDKLRTDFEIIRDSGSYVRTVLGVVEHSSKRHRKPRKFRSDDE
jgi:hypothetical protein